MTRIASTLRLDWDKSEATAREAAAFAGRIIGLHAPYISHGEIQTGLSDDGKTWVPDLAARYEADFLDLGEDRDLLTARLADGTLAGIAIVAWEETPRRKFAVLEDMAVDPDQRAWHWRGPARSRGCTREGARRGLAVSGKRQGKSARPCLLRTARV